ncbi:hypothetical protein ACFLRG_02240 [Bacteroidota bacterium]
MKKSTFSILFLAVFCIFLSCKKEEEVSPSERFLLLTNQVWESDSLLANGVDASEEGQILFAFNGETSFNEDGTGSLGIYEGTWILKNNDEQLIIYADSLPGPVTCIIDELSETSLKINTGIISTTVPISYISVRMTFITKE